MLYIQQNKYFPASALLVALLCSFTFSLDAQEKRKQAEATPEVIGAPSTPPAATALEMATSRDRARAFGDRDRNQDPIHVYRLQAGSSSDYSNSIVTAVRNILDPTCRVLLVPEGNTMLVRCSPDQLIVADGVVHDIDTVKPNYKLTFTISESDGAKRLGVQHFILDVLPGERTTLKNGSKVPLVTGTSGPGSSPQFTYVDVGLNFDVTLEQGENGLLLKSKVEQSASNEEKTMNGVTEPVIRQTVLQGSATLLVGKPLLLGSIDIAGSTRHSEVEVLLEAAK